MTTAEVLWWIEQRLALDREIAEAERAVAKKAAKGGKGKR